VIKQLHEQPETNHEVKVLGAVLLDGHSALSKVRFIVAPEHFQDQRNRAIYTRILALYDQSPDIEPAALAAHLQNGGTGAVYISDLMTATATSADVVHHAEMLRENHARRALTGKLASAARAAQDGKPIAEIVASIHESLSHLDGQLYSHGGSAAKVWTHDDLLRADLPAPSWLVPEVLPDEGLVALAGKKKLGKSWLGLQLTQAAASGGRAFDRQAKQGSVLYFALEDGERRVRDRLIKQRASEGLPITYRFALTPLDSPGGLRELERLIREIRPRLVVIDTLAAALTRKLDQNKAGDMAEIYNGLRNLAHRNKCCVLIVAHHGKSTRNDPGDDIRGSSAQGGGVDLSLGLYKESATSILRGEGRDVADFEWRVEFDASHTWSWHLVGDHRQIVRDENEGKVVTAVLELGGSMVPVEAIARHLGKKRDWVQRKLPGLVASGRLRKDPDPTSKANRLLYSIPDWTTGQKDGPARQSELRLGASPGNCEC
jgi:hypothetical protein